MAFSFLTLRELSTKTDIEYPIVVKTTDLNYELIASSTSLPMDTEIVLEKPMFLKFVLVEISTFHDEEGKRKEKGNEFVDDRNKYIGKELLIPLCYPGTLKILQKGQLERYSNIKEVIDDCPMYIRIDNDTLYTPPDKIHPTSSLSRGVKLEVKEQREIGGVIFLKCKSVKTSKEYLLRKDMEIECSPIGDLGERTLLHLAAESVALPKIIQFNHVWPDDIALNDDEEASMFLMLTGGPMTVTKSFVEKKVYVARMSSDDCNTQHSVVGLISENEWANDFIKIVNFESTIKKDEYIRSKFGESPDSHFLTSSLYAINPREASVVWLRAQKTTSTGEKQTMCENVEKESGEYVGLHQNPDETVNQQVVDENTSVYEQPVSINQGHGHPTQEVKLPLKVKRNDSHILQRIKNQLVRHGKGKQATDNDETEEVEEKAQDLKNVKKEEQTSASTIKATGSCAQAPSPVEGPDNTYAMLSTAELPPHQKSNGNRPLPDLPFYSNVNIPDEAKINYEDEAGVYLEMDANAWQKTTSSKPKKQQPLPESNISSQSNHDEDFYMYTIAEVEECLSKCGLSRFALECSSNQLDGAFFKDFDLNELKSEPFNLNSIELIKVKKIIERGWRPKT